MDEISDQYECTIDALHDDSASVVAINKSDDRAEMAQVKKCHIPDSKRYVGAKFTMIVEPGGLNSLKFINDEPRISTSTYKVDQSQIHIYQPEFYDWLKYLFKGEVKVQVWRLDSLHSPAFRTHFASSGFNYQVVTRKFPESRGTIICIANSTLDNGPARFEFKSTGYNEQSLQQLIQWIVSLETLRTISFGPMIPRP